VRSRKKNKKPFFLSKDEQNNIDFIKPSIDKPLLIGLLVDVSGSMTASINNIEGSSQSRIESFQKSFDELIEKAKELCKEPDGQRIAPLFKIFVYGFGFGNILSSFLFGDKPKVRSILKPENDRDIFNIEELVDNWKQHEYYVKSVAKEMFGATPMYEAFTVALKKIKNELNNSFLTKPVILFVISDGEPTDASPSEIIEIANELKEMGVVIISTLITNQNMTVYKKLYSAPEDHWNIETRLMFECASELPKGSPFHAHIREFNWEFGTNPKLFAQVNQSETLKEFLKLLVSPLEERNY